MATNLRCPAGMQSILTMAFIFVLSLNLCAQSKLVAASNSAPSMGDSSSALFEVTRLAAATDRDLASADIGGGTMRWVTFWRRDSAHKAQIAAALRRNLQLAVPPLVQDAQTSHGGISATFKLYNDLTVICESLDSLIEPSVHASKAKYEVLSNDLSEMNRVRQELSVHIQQVATLLEGKNPGLVSSGRHPKKIISDDDIPEKPSPRRQTSPN
jgi:hypothetical protein